MPASAPPPMTAEEMAVAEANAAALGVSVDQLMENAGRAIAEEVQRRVPVSAGPVLVLAGPGNNGGDGSCAAHYLGLWGYRVLVRYLLPPSEIRGAAARRCYERIAEPGEPPVGLPEPSELEGCALVVDALLGSGQSGSLRPLFRDAAERVRTSRVPVLSIDVPSGLHDPAGIHPRWTIALTAPKVGMGPENSGEISVREIGIPPDAIHGTGPGDLLAYPTPAKRGRRGRSARLVVIGGGPYAGAPALAGLAALRVGAERATILAPEPAAGRAQSFSPNLVVRAFGEERFRPRDVRPIREWLYEVPARAVVLGMGVGRHPETLQAMRELIQVLAGSVPLVVDADALDAIPLHLPHRGGFDIVATPNPGEFARVFGGHPDAPDPERAREVQSIASARGIALLVKGPVDLLSDGRRTARNAHHALAMTVSGVGDVLAGTVGALLGEGLPAMSAGRLGAWLVGDAGSRAFESKGFGLVATDVLDALPTALSEGLRKVRSPGDPRPG